MSSKTLFITGASTGIGAETARAAVRDGWRVALFARSQDKLDALVAELGTEAALALPGDVTKMSDLEDAVAKPKPISAALTRSLPMPGGVLIPPASRKATRGMARHDGDQRHGHALDAQGQL